MSLLKEKLYEVLSSLLPIVILVLLLVFSIFDVSGDIILRFLTGAFLILIGLGIFLWGVDLAMNPIGEYMAKEIATSKTAAKVAILSFLLGFLVTVAEPDLLILGKQVEAASGNTINSLFMVYMVSIGVGILISLGTFRLLRSASYSLFMALAYAVNFTLAIFVSEEFLAISFDSSGATTGALTTPFILALSAGLARIKGGASKEEDSFGMVGVMSAGPIMAVMLMSILTGQKNIQGEAAEFIPAEGVLEPIISALPSILLESVVALLPLTTLFVVYNIFKFKISGSELGGIAKGLIYTLIGLALFLTGVNSGFLDMGQIIGRQIAANYDKFLPLLGFVIGMIVVLVEPAVHVLGHQIEDATGGRIPMKLIKMTLSIGVGLAIAGSMIRITVPWMKLWYFLLPGFAIAIFLSFFSDPVFVGIAYDAGGVASGPMTATFVLAFAQGAAAMTPTANVLVDGFGVIAMVAMAPVLSIMILGAVFRRREVKKPKIQPVGAQEVVIASDGAVFYDCVTAIVKRGLAEVAVELAQEKGAGGSTIIHGRGTGREDIKVLGFDLHEEKEIVIWITDSRISRSIAEHLWSELDLAGEGEGTVYIMPASAIGLDVPMDFAIRDD